jgi:ABC-type sugar transport system substrate-binding protein
LGGKATEKNSRFHRRVRKEITKVSVNLEGYGGLKVEIGVEKVLFSAILFFTLFVTSCMPALPTESMKVWTYKDISIGFLQNDSGGEWRTTNIASIKETAEELGIVLKLYESQNKASQIAGFHQFNHDPEMNVIVLSAIETTGWEEVLQEARNVGKIVILEDRRINAP